VALPQVPASETPARHDSASIADGVERRVDPRSITVRRIAGAIWTAVVSFGLLVGLLSGAIAAGPSLGVALLALGIWLLATAGLAALAWGWPALRHRYVSYRLDEQGIRIRGGVVWRSTVSIPQSRVQHTDVQQGPLERAFGLATLVVHTAGTHHASIGLPDLAHDVALRIRDQLIAEEGEGRTGG